MQDAEQPRPAQAASRPAQLWSANVVAAPSSGPRSAAAHSLAKIKWRTAPARGAPDASTQRSFSTLRLEEDAAQGRDLALQSLSALNSAAGVKLKLEGKKCSIQTVDASAATEQQVARSSERRYSVEGQEALPEASCPDLDSFLLGTAVSEPSQSQIDR